MGRISEASKRQDVTELERLTKIAKRVQELESAAQRIESELADLERSLKDPSAAILSEAPKSEVEFGARPSIRIAIDWNKTAVRRAPVVIEERKASQALVSFLAEICAAMGEAALDQLAKLKISRGPLVSKQPQADFINNGNGTVYAHHPIPGSKYFVITHSGTTEKIDAIHSAARLLGLKEAVKATRA